MFEPRELFLRYQLESKVNNSVRLVCNSDFDFHEATEVNGMKFPDTIGGVIIPGRTGPALFINANKSKEEQQFHKKHETVHLLLGHPYQSGKSDADKEAEVNEYL